MTNRFVRNNRKTQQSQTVPSTVNQPAGDNVAFRGGITHGINSSRKWINYGDIFKPGVNLVNEELIKAKADLAGQAKWLAENPRVLVVIEGRCDERGTREYNLALGERRAMAARSYLIAQGISPDRIRII